MKILFDGQIFVEQAAGGISRYYTSLALGMNARSGITARIVAPLHRNDILAGLKDAPVFGFGLPNKRGAVRLCRLAQKAMSPVVDRMFSADIVHETYFSARPHLTWARRRVTTMYDMVHELYFPGNPTSDHKRATLARCDHVFCISHNTKKDLCELFDFPAERASVTHIAYQDFSGFAGTAAPAQLSGAPYFLFVGNRASYKNFDAMLRAFAGVPRFVQDFCIACFGGGPLSASERATFARLGLAEDAVIHLPGGDDVLGAAYANATAFVYPSLYEGFGIPPLEAMSASCPVLSSNSSSLPEVVGDAALTFAPTDIEALRDAMMRVTESVDLRQELIRRGHQRRQLFSWERCVQQTLDTYRRIM